jgi:hypothetical protein
MHAQELSYSYRMSVSLRMYAQSSSVRRWKLASRSSRRVGRNRRAKRPWGSSHFSTGLSPKDTLFSWFAGAPSNS